MKPRIAFVGVKRPRGAWVVVAVRQASFSDQVKA